MKLEKKAITKPMETQRKFLRSDAWDEWSKLETDQRKGIPIPLEQKPYPKDAQLIDLVSPKCFTIGRMPLIEAFRLRRSHRRFTGEPLTLEELSFLLWATQGISKTKKPGKNTDSRSNASLRIFRTVPSGGARHPFETYLLVNQVSGLKPGLYRYLSLEHRLCFLYAESELVEKVYDACRKQQQVRNSAVTFIWTAVPYRTEWRYDMLSAKMIAQETGHICQNLYLACEAIRAGTCAIGAYDQEKLDVILRVDGNKELAVYVAPVGKIHLSKSQHQDT